MKRVFFLFVFFIPFAGNSQTFGELNTVWKNQTFSSFAFGIPGAGTYHIITESRYEYISDTVVGLDTFQLVSVCGKKMSINNPNIESLEWTDTVYVYQDSSRVYFGALDSFNLIYDFNLVVGDSAKVYSGFGSPLDTTTYTHVIAVDSVLINDTYRKRIEFDSISILNFKPRMKWVEGVGDVEYGVFVDYIFHYDINYDFLCFIEDDSTWIGDCPIDYDCPELTPIVLPSPSPEVPNDSTQFVEGLEIYPNPFESSIVLLYSEADTVYSLRMFDLNGKIVHEELIYGNYHVLELEHLSAGVYIVYLWDAKKSLTAKIVKL